MTGMRKALISALPGTPRWILAFFTYAMSRRAYPCRHVLDGHLRPVYSLSAASDRLRAPVLWCRDGVAVLPSFGVLAGGWEIELQAGDGAILIVEGELYPLGLGAGR